MCSISVDPMPSMILTPVASWNAFQVATGRCSPADTQRRRLDSPAVASPAIIALYAVGAVKQIVTPCSAMCRASSAGVAFSMSSVEAPTRSGKTTRPPSPNVKASGGVPVNTSSGVGRSTCVENVSAFASTSRWKCMVAFGRPVVPDVKASSATSSAAVSTGVNWCDTCITLRPRSSSPSPP